MEPGSKVRSDIVRAFPDHRLLVQHCPEPPPAPCWLAVLLVVGLAFEVGSRLLTAFGVQQARPVLALSVMVVAIVVMLLFLEPVDGPWAWLIVPGLMTATVPLVQRLLVWAATDVPSADEHR